MPYVARTGPGSPTGLVVYEGDLLPDKYRNQLLHAEPGKKLIQTFFVRPDGAGYAMDSENTVASTDPIFRPSDIAVAPDGSVFISDWQDPVVGGHNMLDIERGRIFRLAPIGHRSSIPDLDLETDDGLLAAFGSPNQATRYRGYQELMLRGTDERRDLLMRAWRGQIDTARARAVWLLAGLGDAGREVLDEAFSSDDPRYRILALRVARMHGLDPVSRAIALVGDPDPQVRREAALMLRESPAEAKVDAWLRLADAYDGADRWYLSALRIAAAGAEDAIFRALRKRKPGWDANVARLYWVLQAQASVPYLQRIASDPSLATDQRVQALDALGWQPALSVGRAVASIAAGRSQPSELRNRALYFLGKQLYSEWGDLRNDSRVVAAVNRSLADEATRRAALELAAQLAHPASADQLGRLAADDSVLEADRVIAIRTLGAVGGSDVKGVLRRRIVDGPIPLRIAAIEGLGALTPDDLEETLRETVLSDAPNEVRTAALRVLGRRPPGQQLILDMEESLELPAEMRAQASSIVNSSRNAEVRDRAAAVLPPPKSRNDQPVVRVRKIVEAVGSANRGREVYHDAAGANCVKCHSLTPGEELVGPSLAAIGSKYGKAGMLNEILHPSAGIAHEYASWILDTTTYGLVTGVLVEDTGDRVVIRTESADEIQLAPTEILERRKGKLSIMPEDLASAMTEQEMIDLLEFLATLRDAPESAD